MKAIYKRELKSYFDSMIGYVFIAFLVAITGIYFMVYNLNMGYPYFSYALNSILFIMLVAVPVLTMKCFAEEKKSRTDQLLLTAPVSLSQIVLGKYFAMVTVFAVPCAIYAVFPLIIESQGEAHIGIDYMAILAFFLLGCVYIAIGMFLSALTESQIIAAISTFGVLLILYLWEGLVDFLPTSAMGGLIGILVILTVLVIGIYQMTKNWVIAAGVEVLGAAAAIGTYFAKSSLFDNLLPDLFGKFILTEPFTNIAFTHIVDISGMILYFSLIFLLCLSDRADNSEKALELGGQYCGEIEKTIWNDSYETRCVQFGADSGCSCCGNRD